MLKVNFEVTDTFGGDANYCWVRRENLEVPDEISDLALVRRAKKFAGFTGEKCRVENMGDGIAIYPLRSCEVCFITYPYE